MTPRMTKLVLGVSAPVLALVAAFAITSLVLIVAGDPVGGVWGEILSVPEGRNVANIINSASVLYLSGIAVAIGFKMNLFNIGVDGQYRVAAFTAAVVEPWISPPVALSDPPMPTRFSPVAAPEEESVSSAPSTVPVVRSSAAPPVAETRESRR